MKKLIIIFSCFFLLIFYMAVRENTGSSEPVYCKYVDEISHEFLVFAKSKHGLSCSGSGGALMDRVNIVSLSLDSNERDIDVEKARRLVVDCSEDYLKRVNSSEKIRPYLSHFPFTEKGVRFNISFRNPENGAIRLVYLSNGKISYSSYNEDKSDLIDQHVETYEKAREIVMAERSSAIAR